MGRLGAEIRNDQKATFFEQGAQFIHNLAWRPKQREGTFRQDRVKRIGRKRQCARIAGIGTNAVIRA
ncbi:hypothetical protein SDC9_129020 [bioreactor metagenome]|uniref:Uncharacterized protein n=1 Tax=bioreactor metagenome TaxID=1076179 RepID=A0A645CZG1_9ZZZZ